ncbi:RNA polymerase-associated protein LEO1 [Paramyrothecium foliicola]|nr:RNA polymerase-associated protein LEO1 [Paramyrothecium foliicola]
MSDSEDPIDLIDEGGDDLFGDEGDDDIASPKANARDDDDLASDREAGGYGRDEDEDEDTQQFRETQERVVMGVRTYRHRIPKPQDGSLRVLRVPNFVRFMPTLYDPDHFEPSQPDLINAKAGLPIHVARAARDHDTGELKSNTNIYRWSDGSVTIGVGEEHFEIQRKSLAPKPDEPYNELHDGHYYAAAAELSSNLLMTVGHITEQFSVKPNKEAGDDALSILAMKMAEASKPAREGDFIVKTTVDPELQRRRAEMAEKERMKAQRRRENAAAKMDGGMGRSARGGLSIGDLEGGRRSTGGGRKRGAPGARARRNNNEYDSDDEGVHRHEDYDVEDDFIAPSDEEEEEAESGADDDDEDLLEDNNRAPRAKRRKTAESDDEDAEGDDVEPAAESTSRSRRRRVVGDDDDDDDEE